MKNLYFIPAVACALAISACNGAKDSKSVADSANASMDTFKAHATPTNNQSISSDDAKFATAAANGGMAEVVLGKLAQEKGSSQQVKDFGAMMVKDHAKANDELKQIAAGDKIMLPDSINTEESKLKAELASKSGSDFDKAYVNAMVDDHKNDIKDFENASKVVKYPDMLAFVKKTLPVLKMHLDAIQKIQAQMK
jgi:putative membrane protein